MQQLETGTQTEDVPASVEPVEPPKTPQQRPVSSGSCAKPTTPKTPQQQQEQQRPISSRSSPKTPQQQTQQRPATAAASASSQRLLSARPKTAVSGAQAPQATTLSKPQQQQKRQQRAKQPLLVDRTPMVFSFNPDPRLRSWQRLEHMRLHQMGLSSKLSRRYNVCRVLDFQPVGQRLPEPTPLGALLPSLEGSSFFTESERKKNDVAPFRTFQKPTCGVFFSRDTENKKLKHDLEATDIIKWRYFL
ncbi:hypothetical protein BOX15_Mlig006865g2 [Macrostomum lignano]|uniref:Uncharacterized protein n=1 Tax=Macrostomum lignano TaxID=282301 RepID=A0A267GDA8_9PLAT|nr:hypothetical protein BOX15_Mlig006865g2 [Macrostomum lignano]